MTPTGILIPSPSQPTTSPKRKVKATLPPATPAHPTTPTQDKPSKYTSETGTAAINQRWEAYRRMIEEDQQLWRSLSLEDAYHLLADLRASAERGARTLRDRESEEQGLNVTCLMSSPDHIKSKTVPSTCRGTFPRGQEKFKQDRIVGDRVISSYICSEKCYTFWRRELQSAQQPKITSGAGVQDE